MKPFLLAMVVFLAGGCAPTREGKPHTVDCNEFSLLLPAGWSAGKNLTTSNGVHLVTIEDDGHTLVNFYVYPTKSLNTPAELNEHFFSELAPRLKAMGPLTSEKPVASEVLGHSSVSRRFSFTLQGGTATFDLHTLKLKLREHDLFILIQVRERDGARVLGELSGILGSIKERPLPQQVPEPT